MATKKAKKTSKRLNKAKKLDEAKPKATDMFLQSAR
jgi:hypothetical protein